MICTHALMLSVAITTGARGSGAAAPVPPAISDHCTPAVAVRAVRIHPRWQTPPPGTHQRRFNGIEFFVGPLDTNTAHDVKLINHPTGVLRH
jgi:hypothetical protein